ncbi:hypothetical protein Emed_002915 [Eimeria media]
MRVKGREARGDSWGHTVGRQHGDRQLAPLSNAAKESRRHQSPAGGTTTNEETPVKAEIRRSSEAGDRGASGGETGDDPSDTIPRSPHAFSSIRLESRKSKSSSKSFCCCCCCCCCSCLLCEATEQIYTRGGGRSSSSSNSSKETPAAAVKAAANAAAAAAAAAAADRTITSSSGSSSIINKQQQQQQQRQQRQQSTLT